MKFDYQDYYFWSDAYENDVDDLTLITKIVEKYFIEFKPRQVSIHQIGKNLNKEYEVSIPLSLIETAIRKLVKLNKESFFLQGEIVTVTGLSKSLTDNLDNSRKSFTDKIRLIKDSFNSKVDNDTFKITQQDLINGLNKIKLNILRGKPIDNETNQKELLLYDWIHFIFNSDDHEEIKNALEKILLPLMLYYYFIEYEETKKDISKFEFIIDTNILMQLLGVKGNSNQAIAQEFFDLIKENKSKVIISIETLKELSAVFKNEPNYEIRTFKNQNKALCTQLIENPKSTILKKFESMAVTCNIDDRSKYKNKDKFKDWEDLYSSLSTYKNNQFQKSIDQNSIEHDINLIALSDCYKSIYNFFDHNKPIATADVRFVNWFSEEMEKRFQIKSRVVIPFYKLVLILWREGNNQNYKNRFIGLTWSFVTDNISYFGKGVTDNLFRIFRDSSKSAFTPDNWKSTYLIVKNNFNEDESIPEEDRIISAFQAAAKEVKSVSTIEAMKLVAENVILKSELEKEKTEKLEMKTKYKYYDIIIDILKKVFAFFLK